MSRDAMLEGRKLVILNIGDVRASQDPIVIRTILGSCIAACVYDPVVRVGGINHFMLPGDDTNETAGSRYGVHAMELLVNACMNLGASRSRMQVKVFGGGHMLSTAPMITSVAQRNVRFIHNFLHTEGLMTVAEDLGGNGAREIYFFPDTGKTLLRRVSGAKQAQAYLKKILYTEEAVARTFPSRNIDDSNVTIF